MLHVLDVVMNSVAAGARTVKVWIAEDRVHNRVQLKVADNGCGMSAELLEQVLHGYATTRSKRAGWVGFGLALLEGTVALTGGRFEVQSRPKRGTLVCADLPYDHPDRPPLGDVAGSLQPLLYGFTTVDLCLIRRLDERGYRVDTRPLRRALGETYDSEAVRQWLVEHIRDAERALAEH
ncbi:MAG: ATP-binding protein [Armatimonadetes bacterium]|nr:ATP-binding protein [Armatimonadota bacterium]